MSYDTNLSQFSKPAVADCLRAIRASAKEIARQIGVSPATVDNWRNRRAEPNCEAMIALCTHFDEVWEFVRTQARRDETMTASDMAAELARRLRKT